jgi:hypothetical protein
MTDHIRAVRIPHWSGPLAIAAGYQDPLGSDANASQFIIPEIAFELPPSIPARCSSLFELPEDTPHREIF